jgi:hypothetical protein
MLVFMGVIASIWALIQCKTNRPDGEAVRGLHPYRRLAGFIMTRRSESVVYMDSALRAEKLLAYLETHKSSGISLTHLLIAAAGEALRRHPRLNRFMTGKRLYQRHGRWVTFSMKRKKLDAKAKLAMVKLELKDDERLHQLAARIDAQIDHERSGKTTHADKEYKLFNLLPRPLLAAATALLSWLDANNLLPGFFIRDDGLFTSVVIANLGSLAMPAPLHHLYEWGNCPLFMAVGAYEERALVEDGALIVATVLPIRWTFDERIEDGLTARGGLDEVLRLLEDPQAAFGDPNGS